MMRQLNLARAARRCLALAAITAALLVGADAASAQDPIAELKRELASRPATNPGREKAIEKIIDTQLYTFGQLRQALMLKDWGDELTQFLQPRNPDVAVTDARLRAQVAEKFRAKVRRIVDSGDDTSKAAVANLLTEMGLTVRAAIPPGQRAGAAEVFGGLSRSMVGEMIRLSKSPSDFVRLHALRALGGINADPRVTAPALAAQLVRERDVETRRVAADSLLRLVMIANFLEAQTQGEAAVKSSKYEVVVAAGEIARYAPAGLKDSDATVRGRCAEALHAAADAMTGLLQQPTFQKSPPGEKVRLNKEEGFSARLPAEIEAIKAALAAFAAAGPRLVAALSDPSADVRVGVVRTLQQLSDARYKLAKERYTVKMGEKSEEISLLPPQAADPLAALAKGDWRLVARLMLEDPDVRVRRAAANFLEYFPEARPAGVPDLTRALADPDRFVRWSAARGLGYFTKDYQPRDAVTAVPALAKMLFDPEFTDRLAAAATLESLGKYAEAAVPDLARAVHFGDVENRVAALYIIQSIGPERSKALIPCVTDALKQDDPRVRRAAAETLGKYGPLARDQATIAALRRAMGDEDHEVRINASEALLQILADDPPAKKL